MTPQLATAIRLDGADPCRDVSRTLTFLRKRGRSGAPRSHIAHALGCGGERVRKALATMLDAGLVEVVPESRFGTRWREKMEES